MGPILLGVAPGHLWYQHVRACFSVQLSHAGKDIAVSEDISTSCMDLNNADGGSTAEGDLVDRSPDEANSSRSGSSSSEESSSSEDSDEDSESSDDEED